MGGRDVGSGRSVACKGFAPHRLERDYPKHKKNWGNAITKEQYEEKAVKLLNAPVGGGIKGFVTDEGITFRYNDKTHEFGKMGEKGYVITFFKPKQKRAYWDKQVKLYDPDYSEELL